MAANHVIRTARLADSQILDLIDSPRENAVVATGNIYLGGDLNFEIFGLQRNQPPLSVLDSGRHAIQSVHLSTRTSIQISIELAQGTVAFRRQSPARVLWIDRGAVPVAPGTSPGFECVKHGLDELLSDWKILEE